MRKICTDYNQCDDYTMHGNNIDCYMPKEICCPINQLATTRHIPLNEAENIEEFFQLASGKPDPEPILI